MSVQTTIIKCAMRVICPLALNSPEDQFTLLHVPGTCSTEINFLGSRYMAGIQHQISGSGCHKLPNKVTYAIGIEAGEFLYALQDRGEPDQVSQWASLVHYVVRPVFGQLHGEWLLKRFPPPSYYEDYGWAKYHNILVYGLVGIRANLGYRYQKQYFKNFNKQFAPTNLQLVIGLSTDILFSQSMAFVAKVGFVLGAYSLSGKGTEFTEVLTKQPYVSSWRMPGQVFQWEFGVRIGNFWS